MTRQSREHINRLLNDDVVNTADSLNRARHAFWNADMEAVHGESGRTFQQILYACVVDHDVAVNALREFEELI